MSTRRRGKRVAKHRNREHGDLVSAFVNIRQYTSAFVDAKAREECGDTQRTVKALLRRC